MHGVERLTSATVMATDLRASACLVIAGLVAEGETIVVAFTTWIAATKRSSKTHRHWRPDRTRKA